MPDDNARIRFQIMAIMKLHAPDGLTFAQIFGEFTEGNPEYKDLKHRVVRQLRMLWSGYKLDRARVKAYVPYSPWLYTIHKEESDDAVS